MQIVTEALVQEAAGQVSVELITAPSENLPALLLKGDVNVGLSGSFAGAPDRIDHWLLFKERFVVLAAPDDPITDCTAIPINAVAEAIWLERASCRMWRQFLDENFPPDRSPKIAVRSSEESHLQHLAMAGVGVMVSPEDSPRLPSLEVRPILGDPLHREVHLLVVAGRRYSPALDAFIKAARLRDWLEDTGSCTASSAGLESLPVARSRVLRRAESAAPSA